MSLKVFVSATSGDLGSAREEVKEALSGIGYVPIVQNHFPPDYREVRDMLAAKIKGCGAVVHIVGERYGCEPDPGKLPARTRRRSYTQIEYELARERKKKVYVFVCQDGFRYDPCEPESEEKRLLQQAHREAILNGDPVYTPVATREELTQGVTRLRVELDELEHRHRRRVAAGIAAVVVLLSGICLLLWQISGGVDDTLKGVSEQTDEIAKLYDDQAVANRLRESILQRADADIQRAREGGAKWEDVRELERRRDIALENVDDVVRTVRNGLASGGDRIFQEAARILAQEGAEAALAYLASHEQNILSRYETLEAKEALARDEKRRALVPLLLRGDLHELNLELDRALKVFQVVVEKAPGWSIARRKFGRMLEKLGRHSEAEIHLQTALHLASDDEERSIAANELGLHFVRAARYQEAKRLFETSLTLTEDFFGPHDPRLASQLINLHPTFASSLNNLAVLLQETDRPSEAEMLCRRALETKEKTYGLSHPRVANLLVNLAVILWESDRIAEAETAMRLAVMVFSQISASAGDGYAPRDMRGAVSWYRELLAQTHVPPEEIQRRLNSATKATGRLEPISSQLDRLLGPATPVEDVLASLDMQYKAEGKPPIYFLPLDEPISPHLDDFLGPAKPIEEVLADLDRQYREEGKPAVWFLPLDEPISPHLDDLLGPLPE